MDLIKEVRAKMNTNNEINLTVIDREGVRHDLIAPIDMNLNLMEFCKASEFPVAGTCGGMALCASCQVYIESDHVLADRNEAEEAMLSEAFHVKENSRLACQLYLSDKLEGLVVSLAPAEDEDEEGEAW